MGIFRWFLAPAGTATEQKGFTSAEAPGRAKSGHAAAQDRPLADGQLDKAETPETNTPCYRVST
jgi:hypothetical protein